MEIHREKGTLLGGVHLELTGEVNEEGYSVVSGSEFAHRVYANRPSSLD